MSFVHLHVHSEYSLLDGLSRIPQLVKRAKELGQPAIALTDHGVMYGAIEFYNAAKKAGVRPIIGIESYLARRTRHDRDPQKDKGPYHLLLLAQNDTGYKNLLRLASLSQLEGFYYRPRVDKELLAQHAEGILCATGCGSGEIPRLLQEGQLDAARRAMEWYVEVFGRERFWVELQWHEGIPGLKGVNQQLIRFAREFDLRMVATNDVHYVLAEEAAAQDVLLCIGTNSLVSQPDRMRMTDQSYYLKSEAEMAALFGGEAPEAIANTQAVAEMCSVDLSMKGYHLPPFSVPEPHTPETYLRQLCEEGLRRRYGEHCCDPNVRQRLDYELSVIHKMGFDTYFLIVWDLTRYAAEHDIWCNARGSAAGSVVAYALGITRVDPFANDLLFERFLNPGRISMPDIDMDFPDDRRGEMIEYTVQKYGQDKVAQIITFGTLGARAAVRDVGRAKDVPLSEVDRVAKLIPAIPGKPVSISEAIEQVAELKQIYESTPYMRDLLDTAQQLEGVARHASTHAAGVIISDAPLIEYAPLTRPTKESESSLGSVTQFDMNVCESIGLLKIDFLGLSTLTIMRKACDLIKLNHGVDLNLETIPTDDPRAFELISRGEVAGLFQVEGCLSGDTFIGHRTIKELYKDFTARQSLGPVPWMYRLKTTSCYLDEGRLTSNEILRVIRSGIKPVYRLIDERGQWIKATADHCFLTQRGWVRLGDLDPSTDRLLVKSDASRSGRLCVECGWPLKAGMQSRRCKTCSARATSNPSRPEVRVKIAESKLGNIPWNKGLTAETAADTTWIQNLRRYNESQRGRSWVERLGAERAARLKTQWSEMFSGAGNPMYGRPPKVTKTYTQAGYRDDLGHYVRSSWEADLARVFRYLNLDYKYEPRTFELVTEHGRRLTYTPDFYVPSLSQWFEVKGWMDEASAEKIKLFREQYPDYDLVVIDKTLFAEFQLQYAHAVEWECPSFPSNAQWVEIRAIEFVGEEETYDLQMRSPGNNFVASGFIVHNSGMRQMLMNMRPTKFEHIVAGVSLFRPGPMEYIPTYIKRMHGEEPVEYKHPKLEPILAETYGICVYQEQIMQIASQLAGYTPGDADQIRKAVGKKIKEKIDEHRAKFVAGAAKNGIPTQVSEAIWGDIEFFARYGFNKSHGAAYAVITCQTAYLKAYYPVEYMTALLTVERHNTDKIGALITECRRMGIEVLTPDVNHSVLEFSVEHGASNVEQPALHAIRFGLGAIKNVGDGPIQTIVAARTQGGPFHSLDDFCRRVDMRAVNRRALESLIRAGVLDRFGRRSQLLAVMDRMMGLSAHAHRARDVGQMTLFGSAMSASADASMISPLPDIEEAPHKEMLTWEKELAGVYLSEHPLARVMADLQNTVTALCGQITEDMGDQKVVVAGVVTYVRKLTTKKGDPMAFAGLEDLSGSTEIVVFPRVWKESQALWQPDKVLIVRGRVDAQGKQPKVLAEAVMDKFIQTQPSDEPPYAPPARPPTVARETAQNQAAASQEPAVEYAPEMPEEPPWDVERGAPSVERRASISPAPDAIPDNDQPSTLPPFGRPTSRPSGVQSPTSRLVLVTFRRSTNEQRDLARLRAVHQLLTDYPGSDQFRFLLVGGSNGKTQLDFPNDSTTYSADLKARLERLLGAGCVRVIDGPV